MTSLFAMEASAQAPPRIAEISFPAAGILNAERVNLRGGPGLGEPVIHRLDARGTPVEAMGQQGKWLMLSAPVQDAWIYAAYVDLVPSGPAADKTDTVPSQNATDSEPALAAAEAGNLAAAETGNLAEAETGNLAAAETGNLAAAETDNLAEAETGNIAEAAEAGNLAEAPGRIQAFPETEPMVVTITEAVRTAVENHPAVLASRANCNALVAGVDESRAGFLPSVDLRLGTGGEWSNNETTRRRETGVTDAGGDSLWRSESSLSISQMLFDGFATRRRMDAAASRVDAADARFNNTAQDVALRAIQSYLDTLLQRELVALAQQNVADHEAVLEQSRFRAEAGGGTNADVEQTASRLTAARAKRVELEGALRDAETRYREAVGDVVKGLARPAVPKADVPRAMETAVQQALAWHPALIQARAEAAARARELDEAKAAFYPKIAMEVSGSKNENLDGLDAPGEDLSGMLVCRFNLYDGGRDQARQSAARERLHEAEHRLATIRRNVEQQARLAANALLTSGERLPVLRDNMITSERVLEAYRGQFDIGKRSLLDLLDAQGELFAVRMAKMNGEFSHLFAHYRVLATAGRLLTVMGLGPGAEGR